MMTDRHAFTCWALGVVCLVGFLVFREQGWSWALAGAWGVLGVYPAARRLREDSDSRCRNKHDY
jgi:hypothetical protein